jgi:hypothetical protein
MDSGEKIYTCNVEIEAKVIKNIETQITKKEPKKKEKKLVKLKICGYWVEDESPGIILDYNKVKKSRSKRVYNAMIVMDAQLSNCSKFGSLYEVISYKDYFEKSHRLQSYLKKSICFNFNKKTVNNFMSTCQADELALKYDGEDFYYYSKATQIAKKEPTIKPKEEFKPVDKDIDNDPPRIEIAEAITVVSQSYKIKGLVKDKSKPIYVEINGRPIEVKNGKFELERFNIDPDVVEELKIVAIDQWNNKSEKLVKVTVKLQSTEVVRTYEELKPTRVKVKTDKDKIAIIIGIEKYKNQFECVYCNRDAKAFREYATRALGVKSSNIKLLVDSKATRPEILKAFKLWLPRIAGENKDIYIFFAGHGLASDDGNDLYILPQDGESSLLEDTAISRVELISLIQKNNPKSVTMFFDTCYSGQTRDERMLVASLLRPIIIVADEQDTPDNFTIFSASNFDQTSGSIKEAQQGMFSYYLMKGLEGKADGNQDKQITNGELIAYLKTNVSKEAFSQAREQDPMLSGDPNQVLMRY